MIKNVFSFVLALYSGVSIACAQDCVQNFDTTKLLVPVPQETYKYADGATILDGEVFLAILDTDGVYTITGKNTIEGAEIVGIAAAKDGKFPAGNFQLDSSIRQKEGNVEIVYLDTRISATELGDTPVSVQKIVGSTAKDTFAVAVDTEKNAISADSVIGKALAGAGVNIKSAKITGISVANGKAVLTIAVEGSGAVELSSKTDLTGTETQVGLVRSLGNGVYTVELDASSPTQFFSL